MRVERVDGVDQPRAGGCAFATTALKPLRNCSRSAGVSSFAVKARMGMRGRIALLEQRGHFEAAHAGHGQVEDDHVRRAASARSSPSAPENAFSIW